MRLHWPLLLALLVSVPAYAYADLLFDLNPAGLSGLPGDILTFNATLTNTGPDQIFLNGDSSVLAGAGLSIDTSPFLADFPPNLTNGNMITADIFNIPLALGAVPGNYFGSFNILGGSDNMAQDILATQNFEVTVQPVAVPEPGSLVLLTSVTLSGIGFLRRKRLR